MTTSMMSLFQHKRVLSDSSIDYVYTDMFNVYESHEEIYEKFDFDIQSYC